jgi:hypothetical protein
MSKLLNEEVVVLVKAIPQVGSKHGETVCCAGVTRDFQWRRLYPIRFRHLQQDSKFARWQFLRYRAHQTGTDLRPESRRVHEESIEPGNELPQKERAEFVDRLIVPSAKHAADLGRTLTLVRPKRYEFSIKPMKPADHANLCAAYASVGRQSSWLDKELAAFKPPAFHFRVTFEDADGLHRHQCGDWETVAAFSRFKASYGEQRAINDLTRIYNEEYQQGGVVIALGTVHQRPKQWLLLGLIRADVVTQARLF